MTHPFFFSILLLVLLLSWKQGHSMIESWCPFPLQWRFSLSLFALGSLQGPSEGCLQPVYLGQTDKPLVLWPRGLWAVVGHRSAQSNQRKPPCCIKDPSYFPFLLGKAFGEDGMCFGFKLSGKSGTTHLFAQPSSLPPPHSGGMGRRINVKLVCWDKSCLIIESKVKYSNSGIW